MKPANSNPKLNDLKKELSYLSQKELLTLLIRMTKIKSENKDLLNFILFFDEKAMIYAETFSEEITKPIFEYPNHEYFRMKGLRKSRRIISRIYKITKSKEAELSMNLLILETLHNNLKGEKFKTASINFMASVLNKILKQYDGIDEEIKLDYTQRIEEMGKWVEKLIRIGY